MGKEALSYQANQEKPDLLVETNRIGRALKREARRLGLKLGMHQERKEVVDFDGQLYETRKTVYQDRWHRITFRKYLSVFLDDQQEEEADVEIIHPYKDLTVELLHEGAPSGYQIALTTYTDGHILLTFDGGSEKATIDSRTFENPVALNEELFNPVTLRTLQIFGIEEGVFSFQSS